MLAGAPRTSFQWHPSGTVKAMNFREIRWINVTVDEAASALSSSHTSHIV
jgi:hypothetical protein